MKLLKLLPLLIGMLLISGCGNFEWFPKYNVAPIANAGANQTVFVPSIVQLDGSGSSDANGDVLTYRWAITSKPDSSGASLSSTSTAAPTFIADLAGTYQISLTVNDGNSDSIASTVAVTAVTPVTPVAKAGADQSVNLGTSVTLDGSSSTGPSGQADSAGSELTYLWSFVSKPDTAGSVTLTNPTTARPTFTANVSGVYVVELKVWDSLNNPGGSDTVTINCNLGSLTFTW